MAVHQSRHAIRAAHVSVSHKGQFKASNNASWQVQTAGCGGKFKLLAVASGTQVKGEGVLVHTCKQ